MQLDPTTDPEARALTAQTDTLFAVGQHCTVVTAADYEVAGLELKRVKDAQKKLDELRKSMTRPIDAAKKAILDFFRGPEDKLARAESGIKRAMVTYQDEQARVRREEQRRADEAAAAERRRLAQQQAEAEAKARAESERLRREAEEAAAAGRAAEAAKLNAKAERTEEKAAEKVEALQLREAQVVAPVIQREPPKVSGVATREVWKFEITDPTQVPRQFLMVDESKIRRVVQAMKGDASIPGVRVYAERQIAAGAA